MPFKRISEADKLRAMEALWSDLSQVDGELPSPPWHGDVLRETERLVVTGEAKFSDWEGSEKPHPEESFQALMTIHILELAEDDLLAGFKFYERQSAGVGSYFLDTLYSEIESLRLYAGIHRKVRGYFRMLSRRFHSQFIIGSKTTLSKCGAFWIADEIHGGFEKNWP